MPIDALGKTEFSPEQRKLIPASGVCRGEERREILRIVTVKDRRGFFRRVVR
jgi:hypothetical protein